MQRLGQTLQSSSILFFYSVKILCCVSFSQFVWPVWSPHWMISPSLKGEMRILYINTSSAILGQIFPLAYMKTKLISIKNKFIICVLWLLLSYFLFTNMSLFLMKDQLIIESCLRCYMSTLTGANQFISGVRMRKPKVTGTWLHLFSGLKIY